MVEVACRAYGHNRSAIVPWRGCSLAAAFLCAVAAEASTTLFNNTGTVCTVTSPCWQAGTFGVLVGLPSAVGNMTLAGNSSTDININGAVGVSAGSRISGGNNISTASHWDIIDFADALATTTNGPLCPDSAHRCSVPTAATNDIRKVILDTNTTVTLGNFVTEAVSDIKAMSNYYAGVTGNNKTFVAGANTLNGTNAGGAGVKVFNASNNIAAGMSLTIQGDANDLVILNIGASQTATFNSGITLSGGITSDQVLINYLGTANNGLTLDGGTYGATFIAAAGNYRVIGNTTINGRVLGGTGSLTWGNNSNDIRVNSPADVDDAGLPEPSTWVLMTTGVGALLYFGRRRQRAQRP